MIIGIGNDLVDIRRIEKSINRFGERFINRCFSKHEIDYANKKIKNNGHISTYAKRFAAKEAVVKAIGKGFSGGISFKDISIENDNNGRPNVIIKGKTLDYVMNQLPDGKGYNIHLSLSDEYPYAQSYVIIEAN